MQSPKKVRRPKCVPCRVEHGRDAVQIQPAFWQHTIPKNGAARPRAVAVDAAAARPEISGIDTAAAAVLIPVPEPPELAAARNPLKWRPRTWGEIDFRVGSPTAVGLEVKEVVKRSKHS